MDFGNLFSMSYIVLLIAALLGAGGHYAKGAMLEASPLGFKDWLSGESPFKSMTVGIVIFIGTALVALAGVHGLIGFALCFFGGFCIDSIFKRIPPKFIEMADEAVDKVKDKIQGD